MYLWITLRLFQAIDAHSGYGMYNLSSVVLLRVLKTSLLADFPWSLQHIFWLWSGADHHDFHHMAFVNNYSTSFRYLDYLFGTDDKYRVYKKRLATEKHSADANEQEWKENIEAEVEKEGMRAANEAEGRGWWGEKEKKE